jgi:hypothetical protein
VGEAVPPTCGTVDGVGGTEPKSTVDVYDAGTATFQSCQTSNFFPYRGYENYWAAATDGVSLFAAGGGETCGGNGSTILSRIDPATGALIAKVAEPGVDFTGFSCIGRSSASGLAMLNGSLYVAGWSNLAAEDGVDRPVLMRYSQSLSRDWKARPTDHRGDFAAVTALGGALYVVGSAEAGADVHFLIEKYDESGTRVWSRESTGGGQTSLRGIVSVGSKLFAAGYTNTMGAGGLDVLLVEIDPSTGAIVSSTTYGGALDDRANGIAVDGSDIYLTGSSRSFASAEGNSVGQSDLLLLRYSVSAPNLAPTAAAGPNQSARPGVAVQLDGSASFDDNTPTDLLGFAWTLASRPAGSTAVLTGADTVSPTFTPDVAGEYIASLIVSDQAGLDSAPSQVYIADNPPPVTNAGVDQLVLVNSTVVLSGSASDESNDPLTYQWQLVGKPAGSGSLIASADQLTATLVPDVPGAYDVQLTASDSLGPGTPSGVRISATTGTDIAQAAIQAAAAALVGLPAVELTSPGNQNALAQFLSNASAAIDRGNLASTRSQLQQAISRTDGCALSGTPDVIGPGRDWITTCTAQNQVYPLLVTALEAITP